MALNSFTSNQGTQSALLTDNTGGTAGTLIPVMKIDISPFGTAGTAWGGSITGVGTLAGVGAIPNIPGGTIGSIVGIGSVSGLSNLPGGSITVTTGTINTGTINLGTIVGKDASGVARTGNPFVAGGTDSGGTVYGFLTDTKGQQYLGGGTVSMLNAGTISTLPNLPGGSIAVTAGTIASVGTIGTLGLGTITGNLGTLGTLGLGTFVMTSGTLNVGTAVMPSGTLNVGTINNGSIVVTSGTMATGTLSPIPTLGIQTFGTLGTTGVSIFGTLAGGTGSGAGTEIFITSLSLSIPSTAGSQQVTIGWGSNGGTLHAGTGRLVGGNFPPGGGIQKTFSPPANSGTNGQLMYFQAGAGTVNVDVTYFIAASTL